MIKLDPDIGDVINIETTGILGKLVYRYTKDVDGTEPKEEGQCPSCVEAERDSQKIKERGMISTHEKFLMLKATMECECGNHIIFYFLFPHVLSPHAEGIESFEVYERYG